MSIWRRGKEQGGGTAVMLAPHDVSDDSAAEEARLVAYSRSIEAYISDRKEVYLQVALTRPFGNIRSQYAQSLIDPRLFADIIATYPHPEEIHGSAGGEDDHGEKREAVLSLIDRLDRTAHCIATAQKACQIVSQGGNLPADQLKDLSVARNEAAALRQRPTASTPEIDMSVRAIECLIDGLSTGHNIEARKAVADVLTKTDTDKARKVLLDAIAALESTCKPPFQEPSLFITKELRGVRLEDLGGHNQELYQRFTKLVVQRYIHAVSVHDVAVDAGQKAEAHNLATGLMTLAESCGVRFDAVPAAKTSSQPTINGRRLNDKRAQIPPVQQTDLPKITGIELDDNGFGGRVTIAAVALAGVATSTIGASPAYAEESREDTITVTIPTPGSSQELIQDPGVEAEVAQSDEPIVTSFEPVEPEQVSEQSVQPTPTAQATPEQPMQVELNGFSPYEIADPDIAESILRQEAKAQGWDRDTELERLISGLNLESHGHQPAELSPYINDIQSIIAEFDAYLASGGVKLNNDQLSAYHKLTAFAELYAMYPTYLAEYDITKGIPDTRFIRLAIEMLRDTDLPPEDATVYTEQQRMAIERLLAGAYSLLLSDADRQDLVDMYTVPEKEKEKDKANNNGNGGGNAHNQGGEQVEQLSETQLMRQTFAKMEALGPEWANRAKMMRYFMRNGYTEVQAAGMIGNFCVEAAGPELNPAIEQLGGGPGRGVVQWGNSEYRPYDRFGYDFTIDGVFYPGIEHEGTLRWFAHKFGGGADNWAKLEVQQGFILWELRHTQVGANNALKEADTLYEATDAILNLYERPAERIIGPRLNYARGTLAMFKKMEKEVKREHRQESQSHNEHSSTRLENYNSILDRLQSQARQDGHVSDAAPNGESGHVHRNELAKIGGEWGEITLQKDAAKSFKALAKAFEAEFGETLELTGGYRSFKSQQDVYNDPDKILPDGTHLGAYPGTSEHGWGMAVDISTYVVAGFDDEKHKWLEKNVGRFGWFKPDWSKENGEKPESWHFEYKGGIKIKESRPGKPNKEKQKLEEKLPLSRDGYTTPVPPQHYNIGTTWNGYEQEDGFHTGADIEVVNVPAIAVKNGTVISVGTLGSTGIQNITLRLDDGMYADYQHLSETSVKEGEEVKIGQQIGVTGNSGAPDYSTGPHLHFGLSTTPDVESRYSPNVETLTKDPEHYLPTVAYVQHWVAKQNR